MGEVYFYNIYDLCIQCIFTKTKYIICCSCSGRGGQGRWPGGRAIYIYIYISGRAAGQPGSRAAGQPGSQAVRQVSLDAFVGWEPDILPVSVRRFPSFRTQPLESLSHYLWTKTISEQPSPWRKSSKRESCYGDRVYSTVCRICVLLPWRVCVCICIYIYIYIYIYTYYYTQLSIIYIYIYIHIAAQPSASSGRPSPTPPRRWRRSLRRPRIASYNVYIYIYIYVYTYICIYIYIYVHIIHIYIYIYINGPLVPLGDATPNHLTHSIASHLCTPLAVHSRASHASTKVALSVMNWS